MEHIYYADRPSVPSTQHNVVHLNSILEHSILLHLNDVTQPFYADAVEVKDETGEVMGTLLWVGGVSYVQLVSDAETENDITDDVDSSEEACPESDEELSYEEVCRDVENLENILEARNAYITKLEEELTKLKS